VLAERRGLTDDPIAEQRAASLYLQTLTGPLHQRDLLSGVFRGLLKVPFVRSLVRRRADREGAGHPLHELLKLFDGA